MSPAHPPSAGSEPTEDAAEGVPDDAPAVAAGLAGGGLGQLSGDRFSLAASIGGIRGLVESLLPGLVFVVVFIVTRDLKAPLVASLAVTLVLVVARLVGRTPVTQALGGAFGVVIGAVWAWRSGQAQDFFVFGLWTNAAYALALVVSVVVRWPAVGVVVSLLRAEGFGWRGDPLQPGRRRRYVLATWLWVGLFAARLAVQVPLYLQARAEWSGTAWLGTARLVMGVPLWALTLWLTWLLVREPADAAAPSHQRGG